MEKGRFRRGSVVGFVALLLGVLIAQIAAAGGSEDAKVASLERDNQSLQRRVSALEARLGATAKGANKKGRRGPRGPQGPPGQQGSQGPPGPPGSAPACQGNGSGDEMVSAGAVCIDKYEVSVWSSPTGGTQYGVTADDYPPECPDNGQGCEAGVKGEIYARSVPNVEPSRYITWFQAQQALANVGKRLPTNAEWQQAVAGTQDPNAGPVPESCNVFGGPSVPTGTRDLCVSNFGAHDMIGNLWEWVADWDEEFDDASNVCATWPVAYGGDYACIGNGVDGVASRFPGALVRGGVSGSGTFAGPFAVDASLRPSDAFNIVGFRGAR